MKVTYFLPWRGEFGQMLMHFVRWVNKECQEREGKKIVCCREGDEALFPKADQFYYEWDQVEDKEKKTSLLKSKGNVSYLADLGRKLQARHEDLEVETVEPPKRTKLDPCWNFKPQPLSEHPGIYPKIVVCPRYREHGAHRNYQHWVDVVEGLHEHGFRDEVALAGMKHNSVDMDFVGEELKTWNYDLLDTTLHFMNHAAVVVATDAGLAHLAVLNQRPLRVIYDKPGVEAGKEEWPWALPHMQKYATNPCEPILYGWNDPHKVVKEVLEWL